MHPPAEAAGSAFAPVPPYLFFPLKAAAHCPEQTRSNPKTAVKGQPAASSASAHFFCFCLP
jgi:hypothetical protein